MSAVLQRLEPTVDQLALIPEPVVQPELLEVALWGRLARNAQVRISIDGSVHLVVEILQPKGRPPFVAVYHLPAHERQFADELGHQLTAGVGVLLRCRGIERGTYDGRDVLQPIFCEGVCVARFSPVNPERQS
jgi:hypothetical protein